MAELDARQRSPPAGVVDDLLDDSLDVSISLAKVVDAQLGGSLAVLVVRAEDESVGLSLTLSCMRELAATSSIIIGRRRPTNQRQQWTGSEQRGDKSVRRSSWCHRDAHLAYPSLLCLHARDAPLRGLPILCVVLSPLSL